MIIFKMNVQHCKLSVHQIHMKFKFGVNFRFLNRLEITMKIFNISTIICAFFLIGLRLATADCVTPIGPSVTSFDDVTRLESYTEGASLCIYNFDVQNGCSSCRRGHIHVCEQGRWKPRLTSKCSPVNAVQPTRGGRSGTSNPSPSSRSKTNHKLPVDQDLCRVLGTC